MRIKETIRKGATIPKEMISQGSRLPQRIRVLDKIKGDSMKNPREIILSIGKYPISITKILPFIHKI